MGTWRSRAGMEQSKPSKGDQGKRSSYRSRWHSWRLFLCARDVRQVYRVGYGDCQRPSSNSKASARERYLLFRLRRRPLGCGRGWARRANVACQFGAEHEVTSTDKDHTSLTCNKTSSKSGTSESLAS